MNYEAFEKIQQKVTEIEGSIAVLRDKAEHAAAVGILAAEIDNLKSSLGGKKRRKRTVAKATAEPKAARKKPGPKPKAVQAS